VGKKKNGEDIASAMLCRGREGKGVGEVKKQEQLREMEREKRNVGTVGGMEQREL